MFKFSFQNLITSLSLFHWFKLPKNDFYVVLMTAIIEKVYAIPFQEAVFLFELAKSIDKDEDDELRNELIQELKFRIENEIIEKMKNCKSLSDGNLIDILKYALFEDCSHWPDEMLVMLINEALGLFKICLDKTA